MTPSVSIYVTIVLSLFHHCLAVNKRPNILFILTDDQDWHMESLKHMPLLQKYVINEGTLYSNHYCTVALCCPSRVNLWTGRAAHNTNVTDVFPPYGGYPKAVKEGLNDDYLPIWMQNTGYNTYYSGKLYNAHSVDNYDSPYVKGFNGSDFILDPTTYEYYNSKMTRNGAPPVSYAGQYSPDVTFAKAADFLDEATMHSKPWFLTVAPIAPHSNIKLTPTYEPDMPAYAKRHAHLFKDYKIPRDANFNPDKPSGVGWMKQLKKLNTTEVEYNDEFQRCRLRALQSVDEGVELLIQMLDRKGLLENTYVFYTTDNGYHLSQHRLHAGKECGFDTDIHIPLIVRGPGVAAGRVSQAVTSHTDLAPTILELAGTDRDDFDGLSIPLSGEDVLKPSRLEHVNVEYWGMAIPEGRLGHYGGVKDGWAGYAHAARNNTYKALRLIGENYSLYYSVWCTGDVQFYDMKVDPGQLENYFDEENSKIQSEYLLFSRPFKNIIPRLDALLMVLKSCKGNSCTDPWKVLHPKGDIQSLKDALDTRYDAFYHQQPKVSFTSCELGYVRETEGPQAVDIFGAMDHVELRDQAGDDKQSFEYRGP